jgi:O-antigen/teichoic acid export membrane protein
VSTREQITSGFSWNTITVVLQVVIQLAYTGLLARLVTQDSFMLMGIVLGIMGFAEIFSQVGVGPALIQRKEVHQQHINGAFYTAVILGVGFTLLFMLSAPLIAEFYELPELTNIVRVVCLSFTISAVAVVPRSVMMKHMRFKTMFKASMISIVGGNIVVGLVLAYLDYNVWAYVWALFTQNLLMTIALWYFEPVKLTLKWEWKYTRELIRYGVGSTIFNALNYLATKLDVLLIPRFIRAGAPEMTPLQKDQSSYFERASYAMTQPITVMGKLSDSVLFSGMSQMQDEDGKLRKTILVATNLLACVIVPTTVFVSYFAPELITVWLGDKYMETALILEVLFVAVIFRTLSKLGDSLLRAKDAVYQGSWFKLIYVLIMSLGIYLMTPYGMRAVAGAIVVATFIHYCMNMYMCTKLIGIKWNKLIGALFPSIALGLIAWVAAMITQWLLSFINMPGLIKLLTELILVFGAVAIAVFFRPSLLGGKVINLLNYVPQKLKNKTPLRQMLARL